MYYIAKKLLGYNDLIGASSYGDIEEVKRLVEQGVNLDDQDREGQTALIVSAKNGHYYITKFLLEAGANPNLTTEDQKNAFIYACMYDHKYVAILYLISENKGELNRQDNMGMTGLMYACKKKYDDLVQTLVLDSRIDLNIKDCYDHTALTWAINTGNNKIIDILRKAGAHNK